MSKIKVGDRVKIIKCVHDNLDHCEERGEVVEIGKNGNYYIRGTLIFKCEATKVRLLRACLERSREAKSRSKLKAKEKK